MPTGGEIKSHLVQLVNWLSHLTPRGHPLCHADALHFSAKGSVTRGHRSSRARSPMLLRLKAPPSPQSPPLQTASCENPVTRPGSRFRSSATRETQTSSGGNVFPRNLVFEMDSPAKADQRKIIKTAHSQSISLLLSHNADHAQSRNRLNFIPSATACINVSFDCCH